LGSVDGYQSPLEVAATYGNATMVKTLIDLGARVRTLTPLPGWSVLHSACLANASVDVIKLLLRRGARVNQRSDIRVADSMGFSTPLHLVFALGAHETISAVLRTVLRTLLSAGADFNATDDEDRTPFILATREGRIDAVKILLDYGANTEYRSTACGTAVAAADPLILENTLVEIRLRALKGENKHLRVASRPGPGRTATPSRIPGPVQTRSYRTVMALQYRYPPWCRRLDDSSTADEETYTMSLARTREGRHVTRTRDASGNERNLSPQTGAISYTSRFDRVE
jgi:hypothetical protein